MAAYHIPILPSCYLVTDPSFILGSMYPTKGLYILAFLTDAAAAKSCPTLCDPRDGSPPGSPVPGILQARTLEWVAISFFSA